MTASPAVAPSSAKIAILAFDHSPKASDSGRFEALPSSFMRWNSGDSCSLSRIQIETASRMAESRNGMRQPQAAKVGSPCVVRTPSTSSSAMNRPTVAVVWIHDV